MDGNTDSSGRATAPGGAAPRIVRAVGELDRDGSCDFGEEVRAALAPPPRLLVVDLSAVTFADSSALHTLFEAHRVLLAAGGRLVVAGPLGPSVRRLFEVSGTAELFEFADAPDAVGGTAPLRPSAPPDPTAR